MSNKEDKDEIKEPINVGEQNQNKIKRSSSKESTLKVKPIAYAGPEQVVYEGSEVILEGSCNLDTEKQPNPNILYKWEQQSGPADDTTYVEPSNQYTKNPSFKAPYVNFDFSRGENNNIYQFDFQTSCYRQKYRTIK